MKTYYTLLLFMFIGFFGFSQYTAIPDPNFENALSAYDDIANDGQVPTANISVLTTLDVSNKNIASLNGIEDFTALTELNCSSNVLTSLNITTNTALTRLYCNNNLLTNLDVTSNTLLTHFNCSSNQITSLNLAANTALLYFYCDSNKLTSLDISMNTQLKHLFCLHNQISSLITSTNTALILLYCSDNNLSSLDVSTNTALLQLYCSANQLTSLNIFTNTALEKLDCSFNQITSVDASLNTSLSSIKCQNNSLVSLNVKNGNNINITNSNFTANNNPNLTCIEVDDVAYSTTNWTNIDPTASYNLNCHYYETFVPDNNFENYLETHDANGTVVAMGAATSMGNGIMDDYVTTSKINTVTNLNIGGLSIADLTGIEDFTALLNLYCYDNLLTSIDISQNINLKGFVAYNNQLTTLNTSQNSALEQLIVSTNQIGSIDLTQNTLLSTLWIGGNQLTTLDLSLNSNIVSLIVTGNQLTTLDLSLNPNITNFVCNSINSITSLNFKNGNNTIVTQFVTNNTPNLTCIEVDDVAYSTANWTNIDPANTFSLHCPLGETYVPDNNFENYLETHDANGTAVPMGDVTSMGNGVMDDYVTTANINTVLNLNISLQSIADLTGIEDFTALETFSCSNNPIGSFDISQNVALKNLNCANTSISNLDVSQNTLLEVLTCRNNQLTSLDLTNNTNLTSLTCRYNQLGGLDLSMLSALTFLDTSNNTPLASLNMQNGNNVNVTGYNSLFTPNLTCINVDDPNYSTANWTNVDPVSTFSNNCPSICSFPTNLNASIPTNNGATLSWLENGTANVWDIKIGLQGFDPSFMPPTNENVSNPFVWTGGAPNTNYDFYVRADCSGTNTVTSAWSGPFTFSTLTVCDSGSFVLDNTTPFAGVMASSVAFADIDGDGDKDAFITGKDATNALVSNLYTNTSGAFTLVAGTPFTGIQESKILFTDVDNDGDQDIIISGLNNTPAWIVELYLNDGSGNYTIDNTVPFTGSSYGSIAVGDVDGNGYKDLIVTGYTDTKLYTNTGGTFTFSTNIFGSFGKSAVDFADVDNDNDLDVVISGDDGNSGYFTKLFNNDGSGTFTYNAAASLVGVFRGDNEFADIDNDGDLDLLITGYGTGAVRYSNLYNNDGTGVFTLVAGTPFDTVFSSSIAFADIDSDGDKDVLITGSDTARISKLYLNDGSGIFTVKPGTPFDGIDYGSVAIADIDNDYDLDILITGQNTGSTRIAKLYLNSLYFETKYTVTGWNNGTPDINKCAVIDATLATTNFIARKLTVNSSLTITANSYVKIDKDIINNGTITIEPTGSVVQIDDLATVTGAGNYKTKIETTPLVDNTRYTYFSSPTVNETLNVFNMWANLGSIWAFDALNQSWTAEPSTTTMQTAKGYIVRGNNTNTYPINAVTDFSKSYNNGVITQTLHFKGDGGALLNVDNDSNLVGNPYPSAINGWNLLNNTLNPTAGTMYFWTHNSSPVGGSFSTDDYAMWNLSGGTAAISGGTAPTGYIASGQGFFIEAEGDETLALGTDVASTLTFNNAMRETGNNTDFRQINNPDDSKIWIDFANNQGVFNQLLIAFLPNATNQFDKAYDGRRASNNVAMFYSLDSNNTHLGIQALPPFNGDTTIPLGYEIVNQNINSLKIRINHLENMDGTTVYLKDRLLQTTHNLSESDYDFNISEVGEFNSRFVLIFKNTALSQEGITLNEDLIVSNQNDSILVKTSNGTKINNLEVYDVLGKQILKVKVNNSLYTIDSQSIKQGTALIIKVKLETGIIINKKIIKM